MILEGSDHFRRDRGVWPTQLESQSSLLLFFHGHRDCADGRQPDLIAFHLRDEVLIDEVMVTLVATFTAVLLRAR